MKKRLILAVVAVLSVLMLSTACGGEKTYRNISAQSNPYSMGTQSIEIISSSMNSDDPVAKFKQSISAPDIELGDALDGKTVTGVTFNNESSITVTLGGETKVAGGSAVYGSITIKQSGMESKGKSTCLVNVLAPELRIISLTAAKKTGDGKTVLNIFATLSLPVGEFTDKATIDNITLGDGANGELTVERSGDTLSVSVKNCDVENPSLLFKAETTTLGKEITLQLTSGGIATIE